MPDANRFYSFVIMRVLLVDNYDSFTFNLVHLVEPMVDELVVWRNDEIKMEDVASFDKIIFSPGPSLPNQSGQLLDVIKTFHTQIPMFGVCLGFQAIVEFFGGELINLEPVRHGEVKNILVVNSILFEGLKENIEVGLYHSWGVNIVGMPDGLETLAFDSDGIVMAFKHTQYNVAGVQFHPESVMTPTGKHILENWIKK